MFMREGREEGRETKRGGGRDGEGGKKRDNLHQVKIHHLLWYVRILQDTMSNKRKRSCV